MGLFNKEKKEESKEEVKKVPLGEEVFTEENLLVYHKSHMKDVYVAALHENKKTVVSRVSKKGGKSSQPSLSQTLIKLKPIKLLESQEAHSRKNREYFNSVRAIVMVIAGSRAELNFFNQYEKDELFTGYVYSPEVKKLLRVYGEKCYKTVMSDDPFEGTNAPETKRDTEKMSKEDEQFYKEPGCKCKFCYELWNKVGRVHAKECGVHIFEKGIIGQCTCQENEGGSERIPDKKS
jgi:hypothetical protein